MGLQEEIVRTSLEIVELVRGYCSSDDAKGFRARARGGLSIAYQGLTITVSIIAARSSAAALEQGLRGIEPERFVKQLCTDESYARQLGVEGSEKKSYALYGYALLYILSKLGLTSAQSLADFIKESLGNQLLEVHAVTTALWLKRFAEAYIHGR